MSGGRPDASRAVPRSRPGCWRLRATRRCRLAAAGAMSGWTTAIAEAIADPADTPDVALEKKQDGEALRRGSSAAVAGPLRGPRPRLLSREVGRRGRRSPCHPGGDREDAHVLCAQEARPTHARRHSRFIRGASAANLPGREAKPMSDERSQAKPAARGSDPKAVEAVVRALAQKFGNRLVTSQAVREQHANTTTWIANEPPDAVVFPQSTEDVQEIVRICAAHRVPVIPFGTGTSLEGHVNAPLRRRVDRLPRHEPRAGGARRGPRLRRRAGRHPEAAQRISARPGLVLSARSRRRRLARRHGGDALLGHQCGALRHDEGRRARAQGRAAERRADDHGAPRQEIVLGLRPHAADGRFGRHARRDHRAYAQAAGHSGGDRRRRLPVRIGRGLPATPRS